MKKPADKFIQMIGSDLILDTNIVIDYFKHNPHVTFNIKQAERIYLPIMVVGELYFGAYRSLLPDVKKKEIKDFLSTTQVLEIDLHTADVYGSAKASLVNKGKPIPYNDIWIAAVAIQHNLLLYTNDAHFREIDGLQLFNPLSSI